MPSESLLRQIETLYQTEKVKSFRRIAHGYLSINYIVETNSHTFFLKEHSRYDQRQVDFIHQAEEFFYKTGTPVILPLKNDNRSYTFRHENRLFSLYPFVHDIKFEYPLEISEIKKMGEFLALMHQPKVNSLPPVNTSQSLNYTKEGDSMQRSEAIKAIIRNSSSPDDLLMDEAFTLKDEIKKSNPYYSINLNSFVNDNTFIHGDYHNQNVFFSNDREISYIFDFEKATFSAREYEIVRAMILICFKNFDDYDLKCAKEFLSSYSSVYKYDKQNLVKALGRYFIKLTNSTWIAEEVYIKNNRRALELLPDQLNTLRYLANNFEVFELDLF